MAPRRYLKKLTEELKRIKLNKFQKGGFKRANLFFQDESRFGLMTIQRRILTISGVKPLLPFQHRFKNLYLFGAYSPLDGAHCTLELPKCNADNFQVFLDQLSTEDPLEFKILVLDNGAFHKAKSLVVPDNIELLFLPPYCPEPNPAEKIWQYLKSFMANTVFKTLDELSDKLVKVVQGLMPEKIISITSYEYYLKSFNAVF